MFVDRHSERGVLRGFRLHDDESMRKTSGGFSEGPELRDLVLREEQFFGVAASGQQPESRMRCADGRGADRDHGPSLLAQRRGQRACAGGACSGWGPNRCRDATNATGSPSTRHEPEGLATGPFARVAIAITAAIPLSRSLLHCCQPIRRLSSSARGHKCIITATVTPQQSRPTDWWKQVLTELGPTGRNFRSAGIVFRAAH